MTAPIVVEVPDMLGVRIEGAIDTESDGSRAYLHWTVDGDGYPYGTCLRLALLRPLHRLLGKLIAAQDAEAAPAPDAEASR